MRKGSLLYHRLWYVRKRNRTKAKIYSLLFVLLVLFTSLLYFAQNLLVPQMEQAVEFRISLNAEDIVKRTVYQEFGDEIKLENILEIQKNDRGQIISVRTDAVRMNALSSELNRRFTEQLMKLGETKVNIPVGIITGREWMSDLLPDIPVAIRHNREAVSEFRSEISYPLDNTMKYTVVLQVRTTFEILFPLNVKEFEFATDIPVAEQVFMLSM